MKFHVGLVFCICWLLGCREWTGQAAGFMVVDSAGIIIVKNTQPARRAGSTWRLAAAPSVVIGVASGRPDYQLFRVTGAKRLHDGTIVVANSGSHELRWYDSDGTHLRSTGGRGGGPGEFEVLTSLSILGEDSVIVWDTRLRRITVFGPRGTFARSIRLETGDGLLGAFGDQSLLIEQTVPSSNQGLVRHQVSAWRLLVDGTTLDSLGSYAGLEQIIRWQETASSLRVTERARPFGRRAVFAMSDSSYFVGTQDHFEIKRYDVNGMLSSIVRLAQSNAPVTSDDVAAFMSESLEGSNARDPQRVLRDLEELPYPAWMPSYASIMTDGVGCLWVQQHYHPDSTTAHWTIFDADGVTLAVIEIPPQLTIHHVGEDFVLGVWKDEFDVEYVRLYELDRN